MGIQQNALPQAKELGDVLALVVNLIQDIKQGKSGSEIAVENIPSLISAIEGISELGEEVKDRAATFSTAGFYVGKIVQIFED